MIKITRISLPKENKNKKALLTKILGRLKQDKTEYVLKYNISYTKKKFWTINTQPLSIILEYYTHCSEPLYVVFQFNKKESKELISLFYEDTLLFLELLFKYKKQNDTLVAKKIVESFRVF